MKILLFCVLLTFSCKSQAEKDSFFNAKGIDVSHFDGDIDFEKLTRDSISFIYIKATQGSSFVDPKFDHNWKAAKSSDLPFGVYHFYDPDADPVKQAEFFCSNVKEIANEMSFAPVLDIEEIKAKSPSEIQHDILQWLEFVHNELKIKPVIYSFRTFIRDNLQNESLSTYSLWVAEYENLKDIDVRPWKTWSMWQYSEKGRVAGIKGFVDLDKMKTDMRINQ